MAPVTLFLGDLDSDDVVACGGCHGFVDGDVGDDGEQAGGHHQPLAADLVGKGAEDA